MNYICSITDIIGREIIDSRGNPTIEAEIHLACGISETASVPSGASTGTYEAHELRDGDSNRYFGKGVLTAVSNINTIIKDRLLSMDASNQLSIDKALIELDGTENKSKLGANAILAVSLAATKASAKAIGIPLYRYLGGSNANVLPVPMMNIINGGAHASNNVDIQEFMIVPSGADSFKNALKQCIEITHSLKSILKNDMLSTSVGDEGGFAPNLKNDESAIEYILAAIKKAGYAAGKDTFIAIDAASSEWYTKDGYTLPKQKKDISTENLIEYWSMLSKKYPIISIEDPMAQDDWSGFQSLTKSIGSNIQIVGDDLFVTNTKLLRHGISHHAANAILIKPNQIGTLTETINAITLATKSGYKVIISHRSGETEETFISDLAVAFKTGQIKAGAPCRTDRLAKYNRLLKIEEELSGNSVYPGLSAFNYNI